MPTTYDPIIAKSALEGTAFYIKSFVTYDVYTLTYSLFAKRTTRIMPIEDFVLATSYSSPKGVPSPQPSLTSVFGMFNVYSNLRFECKH